MIILTGASGGIGQAILPSLAELDNVIAISYSKIGYNTFFTLFLFPILWLLFSLYQAKFIGGQDA